MAKKAPRAKRPAVKRSSVEQTLLDRRRSLERERRLHRSIRTLARALIRDIDQAGTELCRLARKVFDADPVFRKTIIATAIKADVAPLDELDEGAIEEHQPSLADA